MKVIYLLLGVTQAISFNPDKQPRQIMAMKGVEEWANRGGLYPDVAPPQALGPIDFTDGKRQDHTDTVIW